MALALFRFALLSTRTSGFAACGSVSSVANATFLVDPASPFDGDISTLASASSSCACSSGVFVVLVSFFIALQDFSSAYLQVLNKFEGRRPTVYSHYAPHLECLSHIREREKNKNW